MERIRILQSLMEGGGGERGESDKCYRDKIKLPQLPLPSLRPQANNTDLSESSPAPKQNRSLKVKIILFLH